MIFVLFAYLVCSCSSKLHISRSTPSKLFAKSVASANLDWPNLGFQYRQTNSFVKCVFKDNTWGPIELIREEPYVKIHIGATSLHYGQACFEGLKVSKC